MNKFTVLNEVLASKATIAFSSMYAFYVFVLYGLLPLAFPQDQNNLLYWSNVVQLVALPLLAVGQRVISAKHDAMSVKQDQQGQRIEDLHDKHDAVHGTKEA